MRSVRIPAAIGAAVVAMVANASELVLQMKISIAVFLAALVLATPAGSLAQTVIYKPESPGLTTAKEMIPEAMLSASACVDQAASAALRAGMRDLGEILESQYMTACTAVFFQKIKVAFLLCQGTDRTTDLAALDRKSPCQQLVVSELNSYGHMRLTDAVVADLSKLLRQMGRNSICKLATCD